jgi:hypothetical protein
MKIEVGTFYKTDSGQKVRIYALDGEGTYCIHGAVSTLTGWESARWSITGESFFMPAENIVSEWYPSLKIDDVGINSIISDPLWVPTVPKDYVFDFIPWPPGAISYVCNCGGRIDTHKPECPENKAEETPSDIGLYQKRLDESPNRYIGMYGYKKCECGSESVGGKKHSAYCPKFEE